MSMLNFKDQPASAFVGGFVKGLGAPYLLFGKFAVPEVEPIAPVKPVLQQGGLAADWRRVGQDIHVAMAQYGKTIPAAAK